MGKQTDWVKEPEFTAPNAFYLNTNSQTAKLKTIYLLPAEYLQEYICKASDPKYEKCVLTSFEKTKPYLMKGIPELSLPPFDPFELPLMTVNRTLNDAVTINAIIRNIKVEGGRNTVIQGLR